MAASAATAWTPCVSRALPHPGYRNGRANVPPLPLNVASSCSHARLAGKRVAGSRGFSRAHSNLVWEGGKDVVKAALDRLEKSVSAAPPHLAFFPRVVAVSGRLDDGTRQQLLWLVAAVPALAGGTACAAESAFGHQHNAAYAEVGAFLEVGVQLIYLGLLLAFLGVGTFLVIRQVLVRRELESAAKELQERVRSGEGSSEDYYELGAISLRKKLFPTANKYLEQAIKKWDGDDQDLAQVYNALGFSYYSDEDVDGAIGQYEKALKLQPGYITAWNNLGDAYEKKKDYKRALKAYEEALQFDPTNKIALARRAVVKERVDRFQGIPD